MASRKLPYSEGSVFLVPLRDTGYAQGVVARAGRRGLLLGYFFGPKLLGPQPMAEGLAPEKAIWRGRLGDLGLLRGEWPVVGKVEPWNRAAWPIPEFLWSDPLHRLPDEVVVYTDADFETGALGRRERRAVIPAGLERDGLAGYGAVEARLTKLLT